MKAKKLLLPVLAAMLMVACDPGFDEEYILDNQSSHDIVFVWNGGWHYYPNEDGRNFDGTYPVAAGQQVTLPFMGGLGVTSREQIEYNVRNYLLGDSVSFFIVDGEDAVTYYADDTLSTFSPYNFNSPRYTYDELRNRGYASYASLKFRIDDAMLERK